MIVGGRTGEADDAIAGGRAISGAAGGRGNGFVGCGALALPIPGGGGKWIRTVSPDSPPLLRGGGGNVMRTVSFFGW